MDSTFSRMLVGGVGRSVVIPLARCMEEKVF